MLRRGYAAEEKSSTNLIQKGVLKKFMFEFEAMLIMPPNLSDKIYLSVFADIDQLIRKFGGNVNRIERWGNKYLAYEINGTIYGYYALIAFEYPLQDVSDIYEYFHTHEKILRSMIISKEEY